MLIVEQRRFPITVVRAFFCNDSEIDDIPKCDVLRIFQSAKPRGNYREFSTLHIDLSPNEEEIIAKFSRSNRYKIRRALERDNLNLSFVEKPTSHELRLFRRFYDEVATSNGLTTCNFDQISALAKIGALRLSIAADRNGDPMCMHMYIVNRNRARMIYSASDFRNAVHSRQRSLFGRVNRALHWFDMIKFKRAGLGVFDFGGLESGSEDSADNNINQFKLSFGGDVVTEYHSVIAQTTMGRLAVALRHLFRQMQSARVRSISYFD